MFLKVGDLVHATLGDDWGANEGTSFTGLLLDRHKNNVFVYVFGPYDHLHHRNYKVMWLHDEEVEAI